jgi:hypothetical protein
MATMSETWVWRDGEVTITKANSVYVVWRFAQIVAWKHNMGEAVRSFIEAVKGA